jgi:hypothetical protein
MIDQFHDDEAVAVVDRLLLAIREFADDELPHYTSALRQGFDAVGPVFTRARYGEFFWHCTATVPGWLARVILANADAESAGSAKLLRLWAGIPGHAEVATQVLAHAKDEAGHSRLFVTLAATAFPWIGREVDLAHVRAGLTRVTPPQLIPDADKLDEALVIDHLVQMNIGEIRTRLHMELLAPAIHEFADDEQRPKVREILDGLGVDEVRHIGYTARLMEAWCREGAADRIAALYRERLADFHRITIEQTEGAVRDYGAGRFPELLEM